MAEYIRVYADIHSLFDYRRGLVQWLITEGIQDDEKRKAEGDRLWEVHFAKRYGERRMDNYDYPALGLTNEKFNEALKNVSLENFMMYYPTNFTSCFLHEVIKLEGMADAPIELSGVELVINTFPYKFDDAIANAFKDSLVARFRGRYNVVLINEDTSRLTSRFFSRYKYVFKYDILLSDYEKFVNSLTTDPIPGTTFYVPDLYIKECKEIKGLPADVLFSISVTLAPAMTLIPIPHGFYDYES